MLLFGYGHTHADKLFEFFFLVAVVLFIYNDNK
jgi:hypothetical protein